MSEMQAWLHGGDKRFAFPTEEQAKALTTAQAKEWITPYLQTAPLEISVVGDFDQTKLIKALTKTLGALPNRSRQGTATPAKLPKHIKFTGRTGTTQLGNNSKIHFPHTPTEKEFNFESSIDKGTSIVIWKAEDATDRDYPKLRRAGLLSTILSDRLRITLREKLGAAYSPRAQTNLSTTFKNLGFIAAYSPGKPEGSKQVTDTIIEIGTELAEKGATQDELERALKPRLSMLEKTLRQNSYWLGTVLDQSQRHPIKIQAAINRSKDYDAIKLSEINTLAKKYLTKDRVIKVKIAPKLTQPK